MQAAYDEGLVVQQRPGSVPRLKRYLDEMKGNTVDTIWDDIKPIQARSPERTGYPTQKPLALLGATSSRRHRTPVTWCSTPSPDAPRPA